LPHKSLKNIVNLDTHFLHLDLAFPRQFFSFYFFFTLFFFSKKDTPEWLNSNKKRKKKNPETAHPEPLGDPFPGQ
jgi:hypothetical protein